MGAAMMELVVILLGLILICVSPSWLWYSLSFLSVMAGGAIIFRDTLGLDLTGLTPSDISHMQLSLLAVTVVSAFIGGAKDSERKKLS